MQSNSIGERVDWREKIGPPINTEATRKTIPKIILLRRKKKERGRQFVGDSKSITEIKASIKPIAVRNRRAPWESEKNIRCFRRNKTLLRRIFAF
ncbi:hypothetical protein AVEN_120944-1 [Araneus ventricosus]|uniref:Uncharacterized protein n=1 Tax=Araneus ventricosus TaxID=182803 RepID=A0A4Y2EHJ8_ARAVE|nr:hypothetical protein AVEN_120944-1 [Araneus ventricosus]